MQAHLSVRDVNIEFPVIGGPSVSLKKTLFDTAIGGHLKKAGRQAVVHALRDVNLEISAGTRLGIVGHNGAGKSTLLKTIGGIYPPTSGRVRITGDVASMFSLGAGMDHDATGYENIWLKSLLMGRSIDGIREQIDAIAEFSGLGDYLDMPIRTYSDGMRMRLSFSIATAATPDILLMDEWVGAGDSEFATKVKERMQYLVRNARILVLASHSIGLLQNNCDWFVSVNQGTVSEMRPISEIDRYLVSELEANVKGHQN